MSSLQWFAVSVAPAVVAWLVIAALFNSRIAARLADRPNERSLHQVPTPRIGGLGIMAGALPLAYPYATPDLLGIAGAAIFLCIVSLADDIRSLPVQVRLFAHFLAAAIAVFAVAGGEPAAANIVESVVGVFAIVWMTNLFNFMDGSDGLAGGMAAIGFAALAFAAALGAHYPLAALCAAFASASLGFLAHNFPPARVFMGDAGSVPLGFLAGALGLAGWMKGAWPAVLPDSGIRTVHRRRHAHAGAARTQEGALLESASHSRISAAGARRLATPAPCDECLRPHGGFRGRGLRGN